MSGCPSWRQPMMFMSGFEPSTFRSKVRPATSTPRHATKADHTRYSYTRIFLFPAFCNVPQILKRKFLRVEKRIFRIIDLNYEETNDVVDAFSAGDKMCQSLFQKVVSSEHHPLPTVFLKTLPAAAVLAIHLNSKSQWLKLQGLGPINSFLKYCPWLSLLQHFHFDNELTAPVRQIKLFLIWFDSERSVGLCSL